MCRRNYFENVTDIVVKWEKIINIFALNFRTTNANVVTILVDPSATNAVQCSTRNDGAQVSFYLNKSLKNKIILPCKCQRPVAPIFLWGAKNLRLNVLYSSSLFVGPLSPFFDLWMSLYSSSIFLKVILALS